MFTRREMQLFGGGYFSIIRIEDKYIEIKSLNTKHQWIVFKKSIDSDRPVTLYHKHTADTKYYHKHWEAWTVKQAVESIKSHDRYVIENGETIRWMRTKGAAKYGAV